MTGKSTVPKLPPEPVLTRWGTWLKSAEYHFSHFDVISKFMLEYKPDSKAAIKDELEKLLEKDIDLLKVEFSECSSYFRLRFTRITSIS